MRYHKNNDGTKCWKERFDQQSKSAGPDEEYNFDVDDLESIELFKRNSEIEKNKNKKDEIKGE